MKVDLHRPVVNLHEHEQRARAVLDDATWAHFAGAAADELTLQRNLQAWREIELAPRVLQDLQDGHTRCTLLGQDWPTPILVAPMAQLCRAHPQGERATALAAAAQGCGMVLSHQTSMDLHTVAMLTRDAPERGPLWFQLYPQSDPAAQSALLQQVQAAGYEALVLTVDAPVQGVRDRERRHSSHWPAHAKAVHWRVQTPAHTDGLCAGWAAQAPTWNDVARLQNQTTLPIILKGITHPQDALQARRMGVAAVIVSNHGGRTLDTVPATATLLPRVADAVQGDLPLLVDGGIRRGTDVFKALALGAQAVLVGRPCLYGLAHAGAQGVAHVLRQLRDELEMAMTLCGCPKPQDIQREHLQ